MLLGIGHDIGELMLDTVKLVVKLTLSLVLFMFRTDRDSGRLIVVELVFF